MIFQNPLGRTCVKDQMKTMKSLTGISFVHFSTVIISHMFSFCFRLFFVVFELALAGNTPCRPRTQQRAADHDHHVPASKNTSNNSSLEDDLEERRKELRTITHSYSRGKTIGIVFAMQGVGAVVESVFLLVLYRSIPTRLTFKFGQIRTHTIYLICGIFGLVGALITLLFSVDITRVPEYPSRLLTFPPKSENNSIVDVAAINFPKIIM